MLQAILSFPEVKGESQEGVIYVFFFHDFIVRSNKDAKLDKKLWHKVAGAQQVIISSLWIACKCKNVISMWPALLLRQCC